MSNQAAWIPAAKADISVGPADLPTPGENDIVIKNEAIAVNPIEGKIAKFAFYPLKYPAILGSSFAGTVHSVGSSVSKFSTGDRVVSFKLAGREDSRRGATQKYVLADANTTVKLPSNVKFEDAATLISNLPTVFGAFDVYIKLPRTGGKGKVLVYGGSSSVGNYAVQYAASAGYDVVTTASPKNKGYVDTLGAVKVVDHTQSPSDVASQLAAEGPYHYIVDSIGLGPVTTILLDVIAKDNKTTKTIWSMLPLQGDDVKVPDGVERRFESYGTSLVAEGNEEKKKYFFETYLPNLFAEGKIKATPVEKVVGGLAAIQGVYDRLAFGKVSGVKLVVNPQE